MNKYKTQLLVKDSYNKAAIPEKTFNYIMEFGVISLSVGEEIRFENGDSEVGLVIFSGKCDITVDDRVYKVLGERENVFDGLPTGIYIPINMKYTIRSHSYPVEIGVCWTKCDTRSEFAIIYPRDIQITQVGRDNWHREVRTIIGKNSPSINLIVGETINPPGNWSGTPPHRHENMNLPDESLHEELYYFKTDRPEGFGIQRIYSPERNVNELILLKNNTITFMPWGYHQVVAGPGDMLYYIFFLAGNGKELAGFIDPEHRWLMSK